ncbi:MAG: AMP-binding protein [Eubacteriales bacterium]|nr:AMP-binding protein [Eubacteriales bacterium]
MSYYDSFGKFGDKIAFLQEDGETLTYAGLEAFAKELGEAVPERCLVFCFCKNAIGSAAGYLGFLYNRIVPLMVDAKINEVLAAHLLDVYSPSYLYLPDELLEQYPYPVVLSRFGYSLVKTNYETVYPLYEELALLLTTSGSTGSPKLVRQSYTNIQSNTDSIVEYLELDDTERPVTTLPMNYTYGLSIINTHAMVGATMLLTTQPIVAKEFWSFMKENKATSFGGVPFTYEMLKRIRFFRMDLPDLRTFTQAGGKLAPQLHKEFAEYAQKTGKHFVVMYGQTEATARMGYLPYDKALEKFGSMGKVIPGGKFILRDINDNPIEEPGVVGEMVYEGDNVTLGYAECGADLIKGDERGGRLETGDMAKMDEDGYYYIVGRKKRFLKLFGNRVNLDEVDRMVKAEFEGLDCASTGNDDLMQIFITDEARKDAVMELIHDRTHLNPRAYTVRIVEEIPKNEAGKVLYKELPQ